MNVPLNWLAEYVNLPKDTKVLTDKLTSIGHMLDKTTKVGNETVIDLELRGNRADMFGLWGIAREVAAATGSDLKLPKIAKLPPVDPKSPLVNVQPSAVSLVLRYIAVKMNVAVGPSPKWMVDRLAAYGIPSVNNVVDITNYVMVESSHPLHAFDYNKIKGGQLILRRAKNGEKFATVQQGTTLILSSEDLAIADQSSVQCLNIIGGFDSRVTESTTTIIVESAVYNQANTRRTSRRLKTITEGGSRHEKHQDPNGVVQALARAVDLLIQEAQGKIIGQTCDYYPQVVKPKIIKFEVSEVSRLTEASLSLSEITNILSKLEFKNKKLTPKTLEVIVPTFRTDIEGSADLVEEVIRLYGYDKVLEKPIADATPVPNNYPSFTISEKLRDTFALLGVDEVITLTMVSDGEVKLVNPPDPEVSYLRTMISPSLVTYVNRLLNLRHKQATIFEVGKTFTKTGQKYTEHLHLGIAVGGKGIAVSDLTGRLQKAAELLGVEQLPVTVGQEDNIYWAEIDVDKLVKLLPPFANPYSVISTFTPIIEDVNVTYMGDYDELIKKIKSLSELISDIELIDKYDNKLTLRITYHSAAKQLSSKDVSPLRGQIESLI